GDALQGAVLGLGLRDPLPVRAIGECCGVIALADGRGIVGGIPGDAVAVAADEVAVGVILVAGNGGAGAVRQGGDGVGAGGPGQVVDIGGCRTSNGFLLDITQCIVA